MSERLDPAAQWRACTRKKRFATQDLAEAHIVALWLTSRGNGLKTYRCQVPEQETHWHVGHLITWWRRHLWEDDDAQDRAD